MTKSSAAMNSAAVGVSAPAVTHVADRTVALAGTCPACGSTGFESILRTGDASAPRTLIACGRCSLLRFLGEPSRERPASFLDGLHFCLPGARLTDRLVRALNRFGLRSKVGFLETALFRKGSEGIALDLSGDDGSTARLLETRDARALMISRDLARASHSLHRYGVLSVVADPAAPPISIPLFDVVCRVRGLAHDEDPVSWLHEARDLLRPGGRIVLQSYDSGSWAFLIAGAQWAGLEAESARFAFRAADLEVLLDFCGFRIIRRSHFFPALNACAWASSLLPALDPCRRRQTGCVSGWKCLSLDAAYLLAVVAALPLALVESVCHAGSVLMVEAEPK